MACLEAVTKNAMTHRTRPKKIRCKKCRAVLALAWLSKGKWYVKELNGLDVLSGRVWCEACGAVTEFDGNEQNSPVA